MSDHARKTIRAIIVVCGLCAPWLVRGDALDDGFQTPPASARPRTWWHWMNGNITADGVTKDLDWMRDVGIGGVQNFDASLGTPQIVPTRLVYMSAEWKAVFRHAVEHAEQNGLEFTIASSPGWSETGGPWVSPEDGLKKLVWSDTDVVGNTPIHLPLPSDVTGPFGDQPLVDPLAAVVGGTAPPPARHYQDVVVLAWPTESTTNTPTPTYRTAGGKPLDASVLTDGKLATTVEAEYRHGNAPGGVEIHYPRSVTVRSVTAFLPGIASPFGDPDLTPILEVRTRTGWQEVVELPASDVPVTRSFRSIQGQDFRLLFAPFRGTARPGLGEPAPGAVAVNFFDHGPRTSVTLGELHLSSEAKVDRVESKAGFDVALRYLPLDQAPDTVPGIPLRQIVNLTDRLRSDGTLDWQPPPGRWHVIRLGWSLIGTTNHPASPEATGLEVDKYDGAAVRRYLEQYYSMYRGAVGDELLGAHGIRALLTDSIEVGASNWTPKFIEHFRILRGYDPTPWLPAITGVIVGSRQRSDAFLYDFRRTLADLLASEHYGTVAAFAHEHGLRVYGEALEDRRPVLGDDLDMRSHTDVPMAALWSYGRGSEPRPTLLGDMKGAASIAHVYGQNLAAAESMTAANAPWAFAPHDLRRFIDLEFAYGINRPVIHTSVHQPLDDKQPGLSLAIFGQYFNRHESWASMARPWIDYIARTAFLLQQGHDAADVAYFIGEEEPITALYAQKPLGDVPRHYAFDFVNTTILQTQLRVVDGALVSDGHARYRALYLGGSSDHLTLATLQRLKMLVNEGATVIGTKPVAPLGLQGDRTAFEHLVDQLWGPDSRRQWGKGRVIETRDVEDGMRRAGVLPDFRADGGDGDTLFVHRRLPDADIYFVDNRADHPVNLTAHLRVSGRVPEIWHAETGQHELASYRSDSGGTSIPLALGAEASCFVVFRHPTAETAATHAERSLATAATVTGPWTVDFQAKRGAPERTTLAALSPLNENPAPGIRYFSGIATYQTTFARPSAVRDGEPLWIDLGQIGDIAEVEVNGKAVGTAWWPPYRLDIGRYARAGSNALTVRVANLWVNRLIGDAQPDATKVAFTVAPTYQADAPLRPSGLLGPVRLLTAVSP